MFCSGTPAQLIQAPDRDAVGGTPRLWAWTGPRDACSSECWKAPVRSQEVWVLGLGCTSRAMPGTLQALHTMCHWISMRDLRSQCSNGTLKDPSGWRRSQEDKDREQAAPHLPPGHATCLLEAFHKPSAEPCNATRGGSEDTGQQHTAELREGAPGPLITNAKGSLKSSEPPPQPICNPPLGSPLGFIFTTLPEQHVSEVSRHGKMTTWI